MVWVTADDGGGGGLVLTGGNWSLIMDSMSECIGFKLPLNGL